MKPSMLEALADRGSALLESLGLDRPARSVIQGIRGRRKRFESATLRMQRDVERMKLFGGIVISPNRAVTLLASGDRIYVDPRDRGCGSNLMTEGRYEEDEIRIFRRMLRPGATVLDIGANYGYYTLAAASYVRPGGKVIAFEPNPHIHELLTASLYLNGATELVETHCLGVSDADAQLSFLVDETGPGGAHVTEVTEATEPHLSVIQIAVIKLDDHLPADTIVDLVKIDVEGHEERVLRGMAGVIARSPNIAIFMEFIFVFLTDEAAFERLIQLITVELGLRAHRVLANGRTMEVADMHSLRGAACSLILSKRDIPAAPELVIAPCQLTLGAGSRMAGTELHWHRQAGDELPKQTIAFGPYLYLPRGGYRIVIDGDFDGPFSCRLLASGGDLLWEGRVGKGPQSSMKLELTVDAPRLEVVFVATSRRSTGMRLRKIQFWRL